MHTCTHTITSMYIYIVYNIIYKYRTARIRSKVGSDILHQVADDAKDQIQ